MGETGCKAVRRAGQFPFAVAAASLRTAMLATPLAVLAGSAPPPANPDTSIPFANRGAIRDWRADGGKGMWIQASGGRWYYASFSSQCTSLPFTNGIEFVTEVGGELSRWSSIRLRQHERCFFRALQPSDPPPPRRAPKPARPAAPAVAAGQP